MENKIERNISISSNAVESSSEATNVNGDGEADKCFNSKNQINSDEKITETEENVAASTSASTLPNLYNRFVTSFENAIANLAVTEEPRRNKQKLSSLDLQGVANYIREEDPSIIFMVGAGISTSAGIPDFRTPGTGLYDNLAEYNIPNPQAIFEINYFKKNPEPFFVLSKELFRENIKPTPTHHFIRLVEAKGLLRRCFTQNIDSLELAAGLKEEKIVWAHGSHRTSTCLSCKKKYNNEWIMSHLRNPDSRVPRCEHCKGVVKPDIVFFGEKLPPRFYSASIVDFPKCELLIILGTSLVVQPFASLAEAVPPDTPRLLMNFVPCGRDTLNYDQAGNTRDVFWRGECDDGVFELANLLGWKDELNALIKEAK